MKSVASVETVAVAPDQLYQLDERTRTLLIESAPLMSAWAKTDCRAKPDGGMEEWAKTQGRKDVLRLTSCDWYHGTWQYLRLLNMVAVPPWYRFYQKALSSFLRKRPESSILIAAAADYGMLATLHEAVVTARSTPRITVYDLCETPLRACRWYAEREGLDIECVCDNIITSATLPRGAFDLIVTDEFLTVVKAEDKPRVTRRWKDLLRPGGTVVTTAMIGEPTTPELRKSYAARARRLLEAQADVFRGMGVTSKELTDQIERFAAFHTRHMISGEGEVRDLFADLYLAFCVPTDTPGECVNPTRSLQIIASIPFGARA